MIARAGRVGLHWWGFLVIVEWRISKEKPGKRQRPLQPAVLLIDSQPGSWVIETRNSSTLIVVFVLIFIAAIFFIFSLGESEQV